MTSERELMLAGELYDPVDPELRAASARAKRLLRRFNDGDETALRELIGTLGEEVTVVPPFYCDYGEHISFGDRTFLNFGCVILDCNRVTIGDDVMCGPYVQIYAATHPVDPELRTSGRELGLPVAIGDKVWIGGGAIVGPGVTVGEGSTLGAGAVVVRDVAPRTVVAGNPARVVRELTRAE